ncbi:conserved exported hypothetical protein [Thiomonas sp. X19]|uniref:TonB-dependent receptor n=1 Tax=Thiomonas sp. X19 TaxID=1050370 RepID=UPI000B683AAE|nr:TonB-dependent receptor [Thiomonas sp. X19]SCC93614.1 conserved exported hypothetical protein [Thiomonas sp. X19]
MQLPSRLAPVLAAVTALLLSTAPLAAHAGTLSLDLSTACIHDKAAARRSLNQVNPGLGVAYQITPDVGLSGGFYRNSFRRTSAYALAAWTPLHLALPAGLTVRLGLAGGLVSGYAHVSPVSPFAAAGLLTLRTTQGWGVNIVAVPNLATSSGFVGLQLVAPL